MIAIIYKSKVPDINRILDTCSCVLFNKKSHTTLSLYQIFNLAYGCFTQTALFYTIWIFVLTLYPAEWRKML